MTRQFTLRAHDFAFVPATGAVEGVLGTLYVVEEQGNQSFAFIGSRVMNGSFGNITPMGQVQSFAPDGSIVAVGSSTVRTEAWG